MGARSADSLDDPSTNSPEPAVAIGGGQVVVAWGSPPNDAQQLLPDRDERHDAGRGLGRRFRPPTTASATRHPTTSPSGASAPRIDNAGLALVVFNHSSRSTAAGSPKGVYYARKSPGVDWEYPVKIPSSNAVSSNAVLASDGAGAMAMWISTVGSDYSLVASRSHQDQAVRRPGADQRPGLEGLHLPRSRLRAGCQRRAFSPPGRKPSATSRTRTRRASTSRPASGTRCLRS